MNAKMRVRGAKMASGGAKMTPRIDEVAVAQFPMVRHAQEVGWAPLEPTVATAKRGGRAGAFFRDELEAAPFAAASACG